MRIGSSAMLAPIAGLFAHPHVIQPVVEAIASGSVSTRSILICGMAFIGFLPRPAETRSREIQTTTANACRDHCRSGRLGYPVKFAAEVDKAFDVFSLPDRDNFAEEDDMGAD